MTIQEAEDLLPAVLDAELRQTAKLMSEVEARHLVSLYYTMQHNRISAGNKSKAMKKLKRPNPMLEHFHEMFRTQERKILGVLKSYAEEKPMIVWAMQEKGISFVLATALYVHVDMTEAKCVSDLWAFGGYDPTAKWEKGKLRPWNASLKTLLYKIGESFIKVKNKGSKYGALYDERKAYEQAKNKKKEYAAQAESILKERPNISADHRKWYKKGMLPPAHIHNRCRRYLVKRYLSDWWAEAYRRKFGKEPPEPWVFAHGGHVHKAA